MPVCYYNKDLLWLEFDSAQEEIVTIGLTEKGADKVGVVESIELPTDGDDFDRGEVICEIKGTDGKVLLTAPAAGFIFECNTSLEDEPHMINEAPTDEGWIVKIEIQDPTDLKEYEEQ